MKFENNKLKFLRNSWDEALEYVDSILPETVIKRMFPSPVYIRNHLYTCETNIIWKGNKITLPLKKLTQIIPNAYFEKKKTPSMVVFDDNVFCAIIFTYNGKINLVGGYSETEIKYFLISFLALLNAAVKVLFPGAYVDFVTAELSNKVVSTKLPLRKFDAFNAAPYLRKLGVSFSYIPDWQNKLTIYPFPVTGPSISVRFYASGGMICSGIRADHEATATFQFIATLTENFIRYRPNSDDEESLKQWIDNLNEKWRKDEHAKIRKRKRKILSWTAVGPVKKKKNKNNKNDEELEET